MEVIAANFPSQAAASHAVRDLIELLEIDRDLITLEWLSPQATAHAGEPLLLVWVRSSERGKARALIERNAGRHVPFDWAQALHEQVSPETFPDPAGIPPGGGAQH